MHVSIERRRLRVRCCFPVRGRDDLILTSAILIKDVTENCSVLLVQNYTVNKSYF